PVALGRTSLPMQVGAPLVGALMRCHLPPGEAKQPAAHPLQQPRDQVTIGCRPVDRRLLTRSILNEADGRRIDGVIVYVGQSAYIAGSADPDRHLKNALRHLRRAVELGSASTED